MIVSVGSYRLTLRVDRLPLPQGAFYTATCRPVDVALLLERQRLLAYAFASWLFKC